MSMGMVGHEFLKHYAVTFDFTNMQISYFTDCRLEKSHNSERGGVASVPIHQLFDFVH